MNAVRPGDVVCFSVAQLRGLLSQLDPLVMLVVRVAAVQGTADGCKVVALAPSVPAGGVSIGLPPGTGDDDACVKPADTMRCSVLLLLELLEQEDGGRQRAARIVDVHTEPDGSKLPVMEHVDTPRDAGRRHAERPW